MARSLKHPWHKVLDGLEFIFLGSYEYLVASLLHVGYEDKTIRSKGRTGGKETVAEYKVSQEKKQKQIIFLRQLLRTISVPELFV